MEKRPSKFYPKEGTAVAIPIQSHGWVLGVYARVSGRKRSGIPFGYFFGKIFKELPSISDVEKLRPCDAVLRSRFADLGLETGRWAIVGSVFPWSRAEWPMPQFMIPADPSIFLNFDQLIEYSEQDPTIEIKREKHPKGTLKLPRAGTLGSAALENVLQSIIIEKRNFSSIVYLR